MARQRSPSRDRAFEIWKDSKGEKPLVDIASELGVLDTQVRKWKSLDKWEDKLKGTLPKTKRNVTNQNNSKNKTKEKPIAEEVKSVLENTELTDKQRLFCLYYVKYWNATKAYQKAYGCTYSTANVEGSRHLANPSIKREIERLKQDIREGIGLEVMAVLQKYIDIAFADITDYVEFGRKPIIVGIVDGEPKELELNYVDLKESVNVDGSLISEVKQGKDGVSIKLHDKMKALEKLEKYFDLIPDAWRRKIEEEKVKMAREKFELEKTKVLGDGDGETEDDGFLEALKGEISEVWDDAE